jgi:diguanylate cyclase (GGDEF)-like protein
MTLFKQLFIGVSILFFVLLGGVDAIYLANARMYLQKQLASNAQDAATTIALRLGTLPDLEDRVLVETIVNPVFDRGYFQEILVLSASGETLVHKVLAPSPPGVPEWFTVAFPLGVPGAQSLVSSGWRELGRVVVASYPHFAYQQLWQTGLQTTAWLLLLYAVAIGAIMGFVGMLLRPLKEIERFAVAVSARDFRTITLVPSAREFARVVAALNGMSEKIGQAIMEESARAEALRREAFVDPLTSLRNRRGFKFELQSLVQSTKDVFSAAVAIVEIENFGDFNKRVGYQKGDEMLVLLAETLTAACDGHFAVCARLSGAGFACAAINIETGELETLVAAICKRIGFVLAEQGADAQLRCHCGATRREGTLPAISAMLASADGALARARAKGDNEYDIEMYDEAAAYGSQDWRARIEHALDENRIALFTQDVFGLPGRTPAHREVMVRMVGEHGDPIPAAQFLPMATRHGLIARIDCRVLEKLLEHFSGRPAPVPIMALNISARTIADPDATRRLLGLLDARRDLASRLVFEMTEFGALRDLALTQRFGGEVRRLGAQLAIDNFGAQMDSLMLLHALKPLYIKLSSRYSRNLAGNADSRFFVASMVRIARILDIGVFAQAVEDESLIPLLAELGLSGYQGFVSARPVPIA